MSNIWNNAVITNQGLALQAKLIAGNSLNITRAQSGAGTVPVSSLQTQTAVTTPMQTLNLRPSSFPSPGVAAVPVYLTNDSLSAGYTARQIGIYAQDPDEGEILYFIAQAAAGTGTEIPSAGEMPGFTAEWAFYFSYGQASTVNVTVDPTNTVSHGEVTTMLNEAVNNIGTSQITHGILPAERGGTGVAALSTSPTSGSAAPITSGAVYSAINAINTSQITAGILPVTRGGTGQSSIDTTPTSGSSKMVTSGGVYTAINAINTSQITAGTLPVARGGTGQTSVDTTPTQNSAKMVTSGGVYTAVHAINTSQITAGTLPTSRGGTGVTALSTSPTSGSAAPITSGAVYSAINAINTSQITAGTLPVARGGTGQTSVDTAPTSGSAKMVTSGGVYTAVNNLSTSLSSVQSSLNAINTSQITAGTLPVARGGTGQTSVDTTPTSGSAKMVTSGGVYTAVNNLQTSLSAINTSQITAGTLPVSRGGTGQTSVDTTPTSGSSKMVTSGGVYTAVHAKQNRITYGTAAPSGGSSGDVYIRYS